MQKKYIHWLVFLIVLLILVAALVVISLLSGEMDITLMQLPAIFEKKTGIEYAILKNLRFPRVLLAFSVGGALSVAGTILQGIFRNPLVEPYTMGISGGAALGVAIAIVFGLHLSMGSVILPFSGFLGAFITIILVYLLSISKGGMNINRMLLIGVMISFVASSSMMLLMAITTKENLHSIIFWMMGSLDEPNMVLVKTAFYSSITCLIAAYFFARPLNALRLGEIRARHLGINTSLVIKLLFVIASLLTGICVSVVGIIGFVGLVIPHIVRLITGPDYRIMLIGSFLGGSFFLLLSDIIARTIIAPNELPIGVITGIAGGIVFITILANVKLKSKFN